MGATRTLASCQHVCHNQIVLIRGVRSRRDICRRRWELADFLADHLLELKLINGFQVNITLKALNSSFVQAASRLFGSISERCRKWASMDSEIG
jgi:hypothetical protein